MIIPFGIFKFARLDISPPPARCFEELIGVESDARFIALWGLGGNVCWSDGWLTAQGDFKAWGMWRWSLGVKVLAQYCFGHERQEADHYLVLDRRQRTLYAAPPGQAIETIRAQLHLTGEQKRAVEVPHSVDGFTMDEWFAVQPDLPQEEREMRFQELGNWLKAKHRANGGAKL